MIGSEVQPTLAPPSPFGRSEPHATWCSCIVNFSCFLKYDVKISCYYWFYKYFCCIPQKISDHNPAFFSHQLIQAFITRPRHRPWAPKITPKPLRARLLSQRLCSRWTGLSSTRPLPSLSTGTGTVHRISMGVIAYADCTPELETKSAFQLRLFWKHLTDDEALIR